MLSQETWTGKPIRVVFVFISLLLLALLAASTLSLGYLPGRGTKTVSVTVEWRGAFEPEVERSLTMPLENALAELPGLEELFSLSERERARLYLRFRERTNLDDAYLDVREAVDASAHQLPVSSQRPVLAKSDYNDGPVFIAAFGPGAGKSEDELKRLFESVEGTGEAETSGGSKQEIRLGLDVRKAGVAGLTLFSVLAAERAANFIGSFGKAGERPMVFDHRLSTPQAFGGLLLGKGLKLGDLASASYSTAERENLSLVDGEECILLYIRAAGDANALSLSERLTILTESIPDSRILYDYGALVRRALRENTKALALGSLLVVLFTFLFTRSVPVALGVVLSIPFASLLTLLALALVGKELDVMSLAGLAAGSGLLVSSGILYGEEYLGLGLNSSKALKASAEPILYSAVTTACVFLPLLFASPSLASTFSGLGLAVASSLAASVLYVFFFMPAFLDCWFRLESKPRLCLSPLPQSPTPGYSRLAGRAVRFLAHNRRLTIAGLVLLGGGAVHLASGFSYQEPDLEGKASLRLILEYPSGTTLGHVTATACRVDAALRAEPIVKAVSTKFEKERATFDAELEGIEARPAVEAAAEKAAKTVSKAFLYIPEPRKETGSFEVALAGPSSAELRKTAEALAREIGTLKGIRGIVFHFKDALPSKRLLFDPQAASRLGVEPAQAASLLRWALFSPVADKIVLGEEELDLRLGTDGSEFSRIENILRFPFQGPMGSVGIGAFTVAEEKEEIGRIYRQNRRRSASFTVLADGKNTVEAIRKTREILGAYPLPRDYTAEAASEERKNETVFRETLLILLLAPLCVALVLVFEFEALKVPFFILAQIPFILAFPVFMLRALRLPLTSPALVGLILAAGIGVNDSLLLFHSSMINPFDLDRLTGVFQDKFRAILTTTFTAVAGVLPLFFSGDAGTGVLAPLSLVVAAGTLGAPLVLGAFIAIAGKKSSS